MFKSAPAATPRTRRFHLPRRSLAAISVAILAVIALAATASVLYMNYVPSNLDTRTEKNSEQGHYRVNYQVDESRVPVNQLHAWIVKVRTPGGQPVEGAEITVDGDMPQHGHGIPTQPRVTEYLGEGRYLVEGVKFQMTGWWYLEFRISTEERGEDLVRFDFVLQ